MRGKQLFPIAIVLAMLAVVWTWRQAEQTHDSAEAAAAKFQRCQLLAREIRSLSEQDASSSLIAPAQFDPAPSAIHAARKAGIDTQKFFVSQTRMGSVGKTGVREWKVEVPPLSLSLPQVVGFIRNLAESDISYQVRKLELKADPSRSDAQEHWRTELQIFFLKTVDTVEDKKRM